MGRKPKAKTRRPITVTVRQDLLLALDELLERPDSPWEDRGDFIDRKIEEALDKPPRKRR